MKLTPNETKFIKTWLGNLENGARTPEELLSDNYSYLCLETMNNLFKHELGLSTKQIAGYLASLQEKGVLVLEERDGPYISENTSLQKRISFEPDLYFIDEDYIQSLPKEMKFY